MQEYKDFEDMPIWKRAMDLAVKIFEISESFPKKEDYGLTSQIRRSALSISANIAEAFGRFHYADKLNFYYNSRGSLAETKNHMIYGMRVKYIDLKTFNNLKEEINQIWEELNTIITTIRDKK